MSLIISVGKNREAPLIIRFDNESEQDRVSTAVTEAGKIISSGRIYDAEQLLMNSLGMLQPEAGRLVIAAARHEVGASVKSCTSGFEFNMPTLGQRLVNKMTR